MSRRSSIALMPDTAHGLSEEKFKNLVRISLSDSVAVYTAYSVADECQVVVKLLISSEYNTLESNRFQAAHEKSIADSLKDISGVTRCLALDETPLGVYLVFEAHENTLPLRDCFDRIDTLERVLIISHRIARILSDVHYERVVHKDIQPDCILVAPASLDVWLTDFGSSSVISTVDDYDNSHLIGTLMYISPEQTGRLRKLVDTRSDLYSLGAVMYQLLSGKAPFSGDHGPVRLITSHISGKPKPLVESAHGWSIPSILDNIVQKLLMKEPGDRYQSAYGLCNDLKRCIDALRNGDIPDSFTFQVAKSDVPDRLILPDAVFGREYELKLLRKALHVAETDSSLAIIHGASGIGKTRLVEELRRKNKIKLYSGKFAQLGGTGEAPIVHALSTWLSEVASRSMRHLHRLHTHLKDALGDLWLPLVRLIPRVLDVFGGESPFLADDDENRSSLPAGDAKRQADAALCVLVRCIGRSTGRVVFFLDDAQWADAASLDTLYALFSDRSIKNVMFVVSFRDGNMLQDRPALADLYEKLMGKTFRQSMTELSLSLSSSSSSSTTMSSSVESSSQTRIDVRVLPLSPPSVVDMLCETFSWQKKDAFVREMAELVQLRTTNNPFYIREFLTHCYEKHVVKLDKVSRVWTVDFDKLRKQKVVSDDIGALVLDKLKELPSQVQFMLGCASLLGVQFSVPSLIDLYMDASSTQNDINMSILSASESVDKMLQHSVAHGILVPAEPRRSSVAVPPTLLTSNSSTVLTLPPSLHSEVAARQTDGQLYAFMHDKLHEGCFALLEPSKAVEFRRRLGWKLIGVDPNTTDSLTLFAGLDHLAAVHAADNNTVVLEKKSETSVQKENDDDDDDDDDESSASVVGDTTAKALSAAFEIGARRALDLTAYSLAERFFRLSLAVVGLSVDAKPTHSRQLWQRIVVNYVDCQIGLCNIQTGEQVVDVALKTVKDQSRRTTLQQHRVQLLMMQNRFKDSLAACLESLVELGVESATTVTEESSKQTLADLCSRLQSCDDLTRLVVDAPICQNRLALAKTSILCSMAAAAYLGSSPALAWSVATNCQLSLQHGISDKTVFTWGWLIGVLGSKSETRALARRLEDGVAVLVKRFPKSFYNGQAQFLTLVFSTWRHCSFERLVNGFKQAYVNAVEVGDHTYSSYNAQQIGMAAALQGPTLHYALDQIDQHLQHTLTVGNVMCTNVLNAARGACLALCGQSENAWSLSHGSYDPELRLADCTDFESAMLLMFIAYVTMVQGQYHTSLLYLDRLQSVAIQHASCFTESMLPFIGAYCRARILLQRVLDDRSVVIGIDELTVVCRERDALAAHVTSECNNIIPSKVLLVDGLIMACEAEYGSAMKAFDNAVRGAMQHQHALTGAMALECVALVQELNDLSLLASATQSTALQLYHSYGAKARVEDLTNAYDQRRNSFFNPKRRSSLK
eukprot:CAMPEP_0168602360 /NCGR_PEP_ID=MMETSP0420-20121227/14037_1 /TAXON_ID=498008 /ORGANISM="Pessonella sp." /LENGTH=1438 /DNA_ID=CAMNT_0008641035 /DNA_START=68 /DNA_END=4384 /DNA_ORIENTATION=-